MALSVCTRTFKINSLFKLKVSGIAAHLRLFSYNFKSAPILKPQKLDASIKRTFFNILRKPGAKKLKIIDKMPEEYELIYNNTMYRYLYTAQFASCLAGVMCLYITFMYSKLEFKDKIVDKLDSVENEGLVYLTVLILLVVSLQVMVMKLPVRIYNWPQKQKYVFVFYGNLPFSKKQVVCKVRDVIKQKETGLLPWRDNRYEIRNKQNVILLDTFFRRPADLNIMVGYQRAPEDND